MRSSLGHNAPTPWVFDASVAECFDDMLRRSIPQYATMRDVVTTAACDILPPAGMVLDLGCSHGAALRAIADVRPDVRAVGVEVSPPMLAAGRAQTREYPNVDLRLGDVLDGIPPVAPDVVLAVLVLQFLPIGSRERVLRDVYATLPSAGAAIIVEKVCGEGSASDARLRRAYHALKHANGYSEGEIRAKEAALAGVLVPLTAAANEAALRRVGFSRIECVWRWWNFAAWVAQP